MSANPTSTPYTLNEFDIVLSISEAAINAQFLHLFLTPLSVLDANGNPIDAPPPQPGDPEPEYLISHRLSLKMHSKGRDGLFGWIECPRVDFVNLSPSADRKRTVKVSFKFLDNKPGFEGDEDRGLPAYDPKYDSSCKVWDNSTLDDDGRPSLVSSPLNGCTVSFEANLGKANIQQIMEKRYMYPGTFTAIDAGVKSESLLASSLFCLFQGDQMANTFKLTNSSGHVIDDGVSAALMHEFCHKYAHTTSTPDQSVDAKTGRGLPSPDNPFVLGYGISQKVKEETRGEPTFKPLNFQFSVTGDPVEKHNFATLNFLMLTKPIGDLSNVEKNLNAGYFPQTFFETINAEYPDAITGRPVFDAVMGISRDLFVKQYILPNVLKAYTPPVPQISGFKVFSGDPTTTLFKEQDGRFTTTYEQTWYTDAPRRKSNHWSEQAFGLSHFEKWGGETTVNVQYWSDDTHGLPVNGKRTIRVKITGTLYNHLEITNDIFPSGDLNLDKCFKISFSVPYEEELAISSSDLSTWTVATVRREFPQTRSENGNKLLVLTFTPGEPGILATKEAKGWLSIMDSLGLNDILDINRAISKHITAVSSISYEKLEESINKGLKGLTSTFVMPAGNVLYYNGLTADRGGNIFSLVNYKTVTGGTRFGETSAQTKAKVK